ncbi:MAG TPA: hypothetical protein VIL49_19105 [Capillimicrobium sp.]
MSACGGADGDTGPPARDGFSRGANVTAYSRDALAQPRAVEALRALRATGADHVTFPVLWFQETATASALAPDADETPSDASLLTAMSAARALGFGVGVAPHVNVRDGTFRGEIAPADRAAWHASHRAMVAHYAELARQGGADLLVVGSELPSMSRDTDAWRATIAVARERFDGQLTYAANWVQEAEDVRFWDALDVVGIDAYMLLTPAEPNPTEAELAAAWEPWVTRMRAVGERAGKPVRLTEVGYTSRVGTAQQPAVEGDGAVDQTAQARAYAAALQAVGHRDWVAGADIWDWSADGREEPGDYSPQGKRAESVLSRWYGGGGATASGR